MSRLMYAVNGFLTIICLLILRRLSRYLSQDATRLPPGPQPWLLIGNLLDVPTGCTWLGWSAYAAKFGALSRLNVFGTNIIALHDPAAATALFETRSAVFSDRPRMVFAGEMCGWEHSLTLTRYGDIFRLLRRELHHIMGTPSAIARFHSLIEVEARRFLLRVLNDTSKLPEHIHTSVGAVILRIAYGYTIEPSGRDPLHSLADKAISQITIAAQPGTFLVDSLPFLRHLPAWFPGAHKLHAAAKDSQKTLKEVVEKPFAFVKMQVANGTAKPSYVSALLEKYDKQGTGVLTVEQEHVIKWSAFSLYIGGADTTVSVIQSFFLAMLLYPSILEKARAEVDAVTGGTRLPTFADRHNLPYINALCKEVLRWAPIAPMGVPHVNTEDVTFEGYMIEKGSVVMPNIWHYAHDASIYDSPFEFHPERFLRGPSLAFPNPIGTQKGSSALPEKCMSAVRDVHEYVFGFGRRVCPGRELADASLFMFVALSVAALDIHQAAGDDLSKINVAEGKGWVPGIITHPEPFTVEARPRSPDVLSLIRSVEVEHPWDNDDAECFMQLDWNK